MPSGQMRSVDAARFAMVPRSDVPRSAFPISHTHKTTFQSGYLVPVFVDEVLPGDSISLRMHAFSRIATAIVPVMDNLILESFFFFVPNRILWSNWERFMGEQNSPSDSTDFVTPQVVPTWNDVTGTIYDWMGITMNGVVAGSISVNALPFRAYNLIWNDWFRDEDLQTPLTVNMGDGPDTVSDYAIRRRGKRHDYFTTGRPWPAKPVMQPSTGGYTAGDALRQVAPGRDFAFVQYNNYGGIGAPVSGIGTDAAVAPGAGPTTVVTPGQRTEIYAPRYNSATQSIYLRAPGGAVGTQPDVRVLVQDIRTAMQFQAWTEKNARGGTRYAEIVRTHFGVISPDARLQRPEFLGGGRSFVSVNPVNQTSASGLTGGTTVLGEQSGTGTISVYGHGFSHSFTEHGIILGLVNIRSDMSYQQGINRMFFRKSKFDYYWPAFAHLPEQAVLSKEIYSDGTAGDSDVFAYQERWAEYKYKPSRISSAMRSSHPQPLDMWHFSQDFASRPSLNSAFIEENPPVDRVLQASAFADQQFLIDCLFEGRYVRAMPVYSIPGVGSRF